jgi:4-hydroxy-tetrahydrodipicolinate synthase
VASLTQAAATSLVAIAVQEQAMIFEGIYVPLVTPFRADLSIDYDAWGEVIDWQLDNGTHGIVVGGSTGEFFSLSQEERISQLQFAKTRLNGRAPLIAGVNDLQAHRCYELTAAARDIGVDALLVAAPPYALPSQKELAAHCLKIDRIADLPIMLYNYPGRTGTNMAEGFLHRVAQSSNVCAIKESSGDVDRIHLLAREYPQLQLSAGAEDQVLEFFAWGARSWVSVVANFFPRAAVRFYETCVVNGDFTLGRQIMSALLPLMYCLERGGKFLQSVKYACEIMNRPGGPVRPPLLPLQKELRREVFQIVNTANRTLNFLLEGNS